MADLFQLQLHPPRALSSLSKPCLVHRVLPLGRQREIALSYICRVRRTLPICRYSTRVSTPKVSRSSLLSRTGRYESSIIYHSSNHARHGTNRLWWCAVTRSSYVEFTTISRLLSWGHSAHLSHRFHQEHQTRQYPMLAMQLSWYGPEHLTVVQALLRAFAHADSNGAWKGMNETEPQVHRFPPRFRH